MVHAANLIDVYAAVDIPEIEGFGLSDFKIKGLRTDPGFTKKNDSDVSMLKYAASARISPVSRSPLRRLSLGSPSISAPRFRR